MTMSLFKAILVGNKKFPRYAVVDMRQSGKKFKYFTGKKKSPWSSEESDALLWSDYGGAMVAIQEIIRYEYRQLAQRKFTLTVDVFLLSDEEITVEEITEYLERALQMELDYKTEGMGPDGGILLIEADPRQIEEQGRYNPAQGNEG